MDRSAFPITVVAALRTRVISLAAEGRAIAVRIPLACGRERAALWDQRRAVGARARTALIAYAFVRGVPYRALEPITHDYYPFGSELAEVLSAQGLEYQPVRDRALRDALYAWRDVPEDPARASARERARADYLERGREARTAFAARRVA